jgi:hypothetical protein
MSYRAPERPDSGPPVIETEEQFLQYYGDVPIMLGDHEVNLRTWHAFGEQVCPADRTKMQDAALRIGYVANEVFRNGGLDPAHYELSPAAQEMMTK